MLARDGLEVALRLGDGSVKHDGLERLDAPADRAHPRVSLGGVGAPQHEADRLATHRAAHGEAALRVVARIAGGSDLRSSGVEEEHLQFAALVAAVVPL